MKTVKCPTCKKTIEYSSENPFRPFCSERCRVLDLGAWADEKYAIPVDPSESLPVNENNEEATWESDRKNPKE